MDRATYWATQHSGPIYESVTFGHPSLGDPIRIAANVFEVVTLGGYQHIPAAMQIKPPEVSAGVRPRLTLAFPRAASDAAGRVVGREFKRALREILAGGLRDPIAVTYAVYLADTTTPQTTWALYVSDSGGITFSPDVVQVVCTLDNPMTRRVAPIYAPDVFTGLEIL